MDLLKRAAECKFFRAALTSLAAELPPDDEALDQLIADAVEKSENDAFVRIVFAALGSGRPVDARHLEKGASLFLDPPQLAAAAWHFSGDVAGALTAAARREYLSTERTAAALLVAGLWCKEKGNVPIPQELIVQARIQARHVGHNIAADVQIAVLSDLAQDKGLSDVLVAKAFPPPPASLSKELVSALIGPVRESVWGIVPERPGPIVRSGYTVRRAVDRIGRNDPCPCGSGKKYKKCCMANDQERLQESSSVAGMTTTELREQRERFLTLDELQEMRSYELVRLDPLKVAASLRPALINRLHLFGQVEAAVQLFEKTGAPEGLRDHWLDCLDAAAKAQRTDLIVRLMKLRDPAEFEDEDFPLAARLLLAEPSEALRKIEEAAADSLRNPDGPSSMDLAFALLDGRWPALGILVSHGLIPHAQLLDAETLFQTLLETRDKLTLDPDDPFQDILDERFNASIEEHRDSEALQEAHGRLETKNQELSEARTRLARLQAELQKKERDTQKHPQAVTALPAAAPQPAADITAMNELRRRAASLKEELKERHSERNQLRGELKAALERLEKLRQEEAARTEPEESESIEEPWLDDAEPIGTQPVRVPEFSQKFRDSLAEMPLKTVRHAMSLIGRLAAGESGAFTGIKRLKVSRDIVRQRVGTDYRLLFRLHSKTIELLALIPRRDLERKIRSLTAG